MIRNIYYPKIFIDKYILDSIGEEKIATKIFGVKEKPRGIK
jgi:hypothetical protein